MSRRSRRVLVAVLLGPLLLLAAALGVGSLDWCGPWPDAAPAVRTAVRAPAGPLRAGAGRVAVALQLPVVAGGLPPRRSAPAVQALPAQVRALVVESGGTRVGLVLLETVTVPEALVAQVQARAEAAGLAGLLVLATHTHSGAGAYDARLVAEWAATGRYRADVAQALVDASAAALAQAVRRLEPARAALLSARDEALVQARSGGAAPEGGLARLQWTAARDGQPLAELLVFSAHPTLLGRAPAALDPDWPGRVAALREAAQGGVTLVVQGAGGNASARVEGEAGPALAQAYAERVAALAARAQPEGEGGGLAFARVEVVLPRPDASRLVPGVLAPAGENVLCASTPRATGLALLELGPLRLLAVPGEPTVAAGHALSAAAAGAVVVGLAGGYVGYVEPAEAVRARAGEARRQYFGPELLERLEAGARALTGALGAAAAPAAQDGR